MLTLSIKLETPSTNTWSRDTGLPLGPSSCGVVTQSLLMTLSPPLCLPHYVISRRRLVCAATASNCVTALSKPSICCRKMMHLSPLSQALFAFTRDEIESAESTINSDSDDSTLTDLSTTHSACTESQSDWFARVSLRHDGSPPEDHTAAIAQQADQELHTPSALHAVTVRRCPRCGQLWRVLRCC